MTDILGGGTAAGAGPVGRGGGDKRKEKHRFFETIMKKLNVALMVGGNSSEREIALNSAKMVYEAFDKAKYNVFIVDVHGRQWLCDGAGGRKVEVDKTDFSLHLGEDWLAFDYACIMIHGTPGEDGKLQGYLEMMGIPYSTCDSVSSVETFDKTLCKRVVAEVEDLCLAREVLIRRGQHPDWQAIVDRLGLPLFVKPNASGSSCGVTKVKEAARLEEAVEKAFTESDAVLVEEFIAGREFGCGVLLTAEGAQALPVTEIVAHNEFFDYEAKYTAGKSDEITPAPIPAETADRIRRAAVRAAEACHCRGLVRVDFLLTPDDRIYMIEINSVPGMSSGSIVPKQLAAAGMKLSDVLDTIIADTLCRH